MTKNNLLKYHFFEEKDSLQQAIDHVKPALQMEQGEQDKLQNSVASLKWRIQLANAVY